MHCAPDECLERGRARREWATSREAEWRTLSAARHWTASSEGRRLGSISWSRWFCWPGLVVMPWLVRTFTTRAFESLFEGEVFCVGGGCRKHGKSVRCCAGWNETGRERSSREDRTTADACWATEDRRPIVRTMRWPLEWRRRKGAAGCDKD